MHTYQWFWLGQRGKKRAAILHERTRKGWWGLPSKLHPTFLDMSCLDVTENHGCPKMNSKKRRICFENLWSRGFAPKCSMLPSGVPATARDTEEMGFEEGTFTKLWVVRETKKVMKSCEIHGNRVVEFRTICAMLMLICFLGFSEIGRFSVKSWSTMLVKRLWQGLNPLLFMRRR